MKIFFSTLIKQSRDLTFFFEEILIIVNNMLK